MLLSPGKFLSKKFVQMTCVCFRENNGYYRDIFSKHDDKSILKNKLYRKGIE
ncbi:hypothetical protein Bateq7PJ16_1149 [Bacillus subtilis]|nr:Hypothetical Protein U712_05255 [Bacillus subtilis PY79]AKN13115.1 hypothetical protein ABU16_2039 [Bacillus subtilis]EME07487.1 hypothetical protein BS732_1760 [Bacillus subtilis MB73/2]QJC99485.1 hypothetical protein HC659_10950 [Bacillus subtilis subsp. subtilis]KZD76950.1 hypothetical protein B4417_4206 [Bacillus subtilis]